MGVFKQKVLFLIIGCIITANASLSYAVTEEPALLVKYAKSPNIDPLYKKQTEYFHELFLLAMQKSGVEHSVKTIRIPANVEQDRSIKLMQERYYDVHWYSTDANRERKLLPVRVPLFKGLIGLRLMFIHPENKDIFANVSNVNQLKEFVGGQGRGWLDTTLLKSQGFHIETAAGSDNLLRMLDAKRIDYFPRSILEIWHEKNIIKNLAVEVDRHIALRYPLAIYYFVRKDNQKLHDLIELGLNQAIKDGSFDALFNKHYSEFIIKSQLAKRTIFEIPNLNMTPATPLGQPELWYSVKGVSVHNKQSKE